jgi:hypothetical protein
MLSQPCAACLIHIITQGVLHMLLRGGSRAAVAATAVDVPGVLAAANELARGLAGRFVPGFVGGGGTYAQQLFRKDGFFAYADERQAQVRCKFCIMPCCCRAVS